MNFTLRPRHLMWLVFLSLLLQPSTGVAAEKVKAWRGELALPTYPWMAVKHPYFRGTDKVNIYPYPMLDFLSREKTNRTYQTVVLENEYLSRHIPSGVGRQDPRGDRQDDRPADVLRQPRDQAGADRAVWRLDQRRRGMEYGPARAHRERMQPVAVEILPARKRTARARSPSARRSGFTARDGPWWSPSGPAARLSRSASGSTTPPRRSAPITSGIARPCRTRRGSALSTR